MAPNIWPSNHYSSVVQNTSNQNLQNFLRSEQKFMRYFNLQFVYNNASVYLQLRKTALVKKNTLANKTTPKTNGTFMTDTTLCLVSIPIIVDFVFMKTLHKL